MMVGFVNTCDGLKYRLAQHGSMTLRQTYSSQSVALNVLETIEINVTTHYPMLSVYDYVCII